VFVTFHVLWPLRGQLLLPPHVSWHEEGHIGAWNMKLRTKHGVVIYDFEVIDTVPMQLTTPGEVAAEFSAVDSANGAAATTTTAASASKVFRYPIGLGGGIGGPMGDPILGNPGQALKFSHKNFYKLITMFSQKPYDAMSYLRLLRRLHEMAGFQVKKISATSCVTLNNRCVCSFRSLRPDGAERSSRSASDAPWLLMHVSTVTHNAA